MTEPKKRNPRLDSKQVLSPCHGSETGRLDEAPAENGESRARCHGRLPVVQFPRRPTANFAYRETRLGAVPWYKNAKRNTVHGVSSEKDTPFIGEEIVI